MTEKQKIAVTEIVRIVRRSRFPKEVKSALLAAFDKWPGSAGWDVLSLVCDTNARQRHP
jgi:hypothetical protein